MKKSLILILCLGIFLLIKAQSPDEQMNEQPIIENFSESSLIELPDSLPNDTTVLDLDFEEITFELPEFPEWDVASLQGKLKMKGLPLSPSLKIFMKKDSLISASLRAPLLGEAGRLEITPDSILAINKINKTYLCESISQISKFYPGGLGDIQNLLLARFFLPGVNLEETPLDDVIDIFEDDGQWNVIPKGIAEIEGVKYGFVIDEDFTPLMLVVLPQGEKPLEFDAEYVYNLQGYDIYLSFRDDNKVLGMTLELKNPDFFGDMPSPTALNNKYKKVTLAEFLRF